ncbi:MAG: transporter permease subunit [Herbinix sp.]|nr:transporter permease subunit [Herbinix sp.]
MILRHSLLNIFRSWKKSILFFFLIVMVVIILCIGTSLTVTINDFLKECDKSYTTTAVFEYMGADYPDEMEYNPYLDEAYNEFNSEIISSNPAVKKWDSSAVALGYIEGTKRLNFDTLYRQNAVLVVHVTSYNENEAVYKGEVAETLYSFKDMAGKMVYLNSSGMELEIGKYYVLHGEYYLGGSSYTYIKLSPFLNATATAAGFNVSVEDMIADVNSDSSTYQIAEDSYFRDIANTYSVINNSVTVHATNNIKALLPFQQGSLYLMEGRNFTEEDYISGAKVCLMSEELADVLKVKIGDQINLSLAIQDGSAKKESFWSKKGFAYKDSFTIVGLTNLQKEYRQDIFIPKSEAFDLSDNHFTYTLAQVELYNSKASKFIEEVTPLLQDRIRMTVYDQGYASTTKSLKDVLLVAVLITGVCALVCVAVLLLFGFLFIYRQRDTVTNMQRLGTGKRNIFVYFLTGSGFLSLVAVVTGILISNGVIDRCLEFVQNIVSQYTVTDLNYSNSGLSTVKTVEFIPQIRTGTLLIAGGIVFILAICSCFLFTVLSIKSRSHAGRKHRVRGGVISSSLRGGPWKYMWLSIKRGQIRTLIPMLVTACGVILLFQLTYTRNLYDQKLDELNNSPDIKGYLTDIDGKQTNGLRVEGNVVKDMVDSGYLSEVNVTKSYNFIYAGRSDAEGNELEVPELDVPVTDFDVETFFYKLFQGPRIVFTNNLTTVPEFYYSSAVQVQFHDGYDLTVFGKDYTEYPNCIVSTAYMEEKGIQLGNIITLSIYDEYGNSYPYEMRVVGSYVKAGKLDNIYCQLGLYLLPSVLTKGGDKENVLQYYSFDSFHFRLTSGKVLPELKDYLFDKGYSQIKKIRDIRNFIVIEDKEYLTTKTAMNQRVLYIERIFPALYLLVVLIALLIPFILIQLRKREIAMMRGQGTSKSISFLNIFLEQSVLVAMGGIAGTLISLLVLMRYNTFGFILTGIFVACWLIGAVISISQINRCSVQSILKAAE